MLVGWLGVLHSTMSDGWLCRADLWLAAWIKDTFHRSIRFYIGIFVGLGAVYLVLSVMNGIGQAVATSKAASTLHAQAVHRVLRAPSSFFDTTPLGRIVNR
jgi:ATP-binding cassette, subfamily C (CFTR/MRP), member 1